MFATGPTTVGGVAINASAQFDFGTTNHKITRTLLNLQNDPTSIDQVLGSIRFTLPDAGANPTASIDSAGMATFDINSTAAPNAGTNATELIIGGPAANNIYRATDNSIQAAHDSYILGSGATYSTGGLSGLDSSPSWTFSAPTITPTVTVSSVIFGFGVGGDGNADVSPYAFEVDAPEPGTVLSLTGGLALLVLGWRKRSGR